MRHSTLGRDSIRTWVKELNSNFWTNLASPQSHIHIPKPKERGSWRWASCGYDSLKYFVGSKCPGLSHFNSSFNYNWHHRVGLCIVEVQGGCQCRSRGCEATK